MALDRFESYEQLESYLRNWVSFCNGPEYDFVGMMTLLGACLDNLESRALEGELEEFGECLSERQRAFLKSLVDKLES